MTIDLKAIRKKHNLTQEELANKLGITRQLVISIEKGKPMSKSVQKLVENFDRSEVIVNAVHEAEVKYEPVKRAMSSDLPKYIPTDKNALLSIAESNRLLAESQKISAESNRILVESQQKLIETNAYLVTVKTKTTGNDDQDIPPAVHAKLDNLLEAIAEVGSGKKWHSKQEALATLGKSFYEH